MYYGYLLLLLDMKSFDYVKFTYMGLMAGQVSGWLVLGDGTWTITVLVL